jgi:hypothetical protein
MEISRHSPQSLLEKTRSITIRQNRYWKKTGRNIYSTLFATKAAKWLDLCLSIK